MDFDVAVKQAVYRHFAETARAPRLPDTATAVSAGVDEVRVAYGRLFASRMLVLEADGRAHGSTVGHGDGVVREPTRPRFTAPRARRDPRHLSTPRARRRLLGPAGGRVLVSARRHDQKLPPIVMPGHSSTEPPEGDWLNVNSGRMKNPLLDWYW